MRLSRWDGIGFTIESDRTIPKNLNEFVATIGCREVLIQNTASRFIKRRLKQGRLDGYGHLIITRNCSWSIAPPDELKEKENLEIAVISLPIAYLISSLEEPDIDFTLFDYGFAIKIPWRILVRHHALISIVAGLSRIALVIACHPKNKEAFEKVFRFIDKEDVKDAFQERDVETLRFVFTHILRRLKATIDFSSLDFLGSRAYRGDKYIQVYDFVYETALKGNLFKILKQYDWKIIFFRGILSFIRDNYKYVSKFIKEVEVE